MAWGKSEAERLKGFFSDGRRHHEDLSLRFRMRWLLSLAIGNAGALVAVAGHVLGDVTATSAYLLFPSAWCFAIGMLLAGLGPAIEVEQLKPITNWWREVELDAHSGRRDPFERATPSEPIIKVAEKLIRACEVGSALAFVIGVIYPLAVLSLRYWSTGMFAPR